MSANITCNELQQSSGDSPVKTLAKQTQQAPDFQETNPGYGGSFTASLASYDPVTCSWKTSQICLSGELSEFSEAWPKSGMMQSGKLYQRAPLVRHTCGNECSLWPTPNVPNGGRSVPPDAIWTTRTTAYTKDGKKVQVGLRAAINHWTEERGPVNPEFAEWLIGLPIGWTDLRESETP